jgi:hypothetical protein
MTTLPAIRVQHLRSSTAGAVPAASELVAGQIAINIHDGKLFWLDDTGVVRSTTFFLGDLSAEALRRDVDQSWSATQKAQALRNLRRATAVYTSAQTIALTDMGRLIVFSSTASANLQLPSLSSVGDGFVFDLQVLNPSGRGNSAVLVRAGSDLIDLVAGNLAINPGQSVRVVSDAANSTWRVLGRMRQSLVNRLDISPAASTIIVPLCGGYDRFMVRWDSLVKGSSSDANFQVTWSTDGGSSYLSSYNRVTSYNSSATVRTTTTSIAVTSVNLVVNHGSASRGTSGRGDFYRGNGSDSPVIFGQAAGYSSSYGNVDSTYNGSSGSGGVADTLRFQMSDGDTLAGTVLLFGVA